MVTWPWQRDRSAARTLKLRSRGDYGDVTRVDFEELAPLIDTYLGQAAYLQLGFFETLSQLIAPTPELTQKESLSASYGATGNRVAEILHGDGREGLVGIITDAIAADEQWRDLLALWGRRLVGDTLLIARGALRPQTLDAAEEKKVEPVFTALLAGHSRRMAALGLDA